MRLIPRLIIGLSLQFIFAGLFCNVALSQSPVLTESFAEKVKAESAADKTKNEGIDFQKNMKKREMNFAEKQFLLPGSAINYREKHFVSCLIYVYSKNWLTLSVDITIYSTYKINRCDPNLFIRTTAAGVKAQVMNKVEADFVIVSGPHIQMMDFNNTAVENRFIPIGDLNYSPIAVAHLNAWDFITHFHEWSKWIQTIQYYNPLKTRQDIDYTWFPKSKLYKIITDKNQTYVMTNLISEDLIQHEHDIGFVADNLGKYLNLPKGWRYEVSVLDKVLQVKQRQYSRIQSFHMQDEFGNIYMQLDDQE